MSTSNTIPSTETSIIQDNIFGRYSAFDERITHVARFVIIRSAIVARDEDVFDFSCLIQSHGMFYSFEKKEILTAIHGRFTGSENESHCMERDVFVLIDKGIGDKIDEKIIENNQDYSSEYYTDSSCEEFDHQLM